MVARSVLGQGVQIETGGLVEDVLVQSTKPDFSKTVFLVCFCFKWLKSDFSGNSKDRIAEKAYILRLEDEEDDTNFLAKRFSRLRLGPKEEEKEDSQSEFSDSDEDDLSYTQSPLPDDTKREFCLFIFQLITVLF